MSAKLELRLVPEPPAPARCLGEIPSRVLELVDATAAHFGVTRSEMLGRDRSPYASRARRALWVALRATGRSYPEIGRLVGRDHTTIIAGVKQAALEAGIEL